MTEANDHKDQEQQTDTVDAAPVNAGADQADAPPGEEHDTAPAAPPEPLTPEQEIEKLRGELDDLNSRMLRVSADYQNFVRRSQQQLTEARQQQVMAIAKSLVTVLDHFDRAMEVDVESTSARGLLDGVKIVRDELLRALEQFGVVRLEVAAGEEFDPNRHEALLRQPTEDVASNHVVTQLQPGYILGDKTLRPAQVSIAE